MANPKGKLSKSRKRTRRSHHRIIPPNYSTCSHCHQLKLSHRVCGNCGYYKGAAVIKS